ncbi:MAG: DMT family transporter [Phycisphaerales bacterium]
MHYLLIALAVGAGMLIPAQAGFNSTFKDHAGHPLFGALINFLVGTLVLVIISIGFILAKQATTPSPSNLAHAPWWSWLGGFCGATMVFTAVIAVRPLGAAGLIACFVTGQLVSSVVIDHNGWLNVPKTPATPLRIVGVVLLLAGLTLILSAKRAPSGIEDVAPVAGD